MAHKMKPVARERRASVVILNSKVDSAEDNPSHPAPQAFCAARAMPVELLHDGRGIYGIGVSDLFDHQAVAWRCGIEPQPGSMTIIPARSFCARIGWLGANQTRLLFTRCCKRSWADSARGCSATRSRSVCASLFIMKHCDGLDCRGRRAPSLMIHRGGPRIRSNRCATGASITASDCSRSMLSTILSARHSKKPPTPMPSKRHGGFLSGIVRRSIAPAR